ncbi:MAG: hypothetical protein LLG04_17790 [Parachlamydia sp.]|nr:hypothetical protein [Parachlamydia sp.]
MSFERLQKRSFSRAIDRINDYNEFESLLALSSMHSHISFWGEREVTHANYQGAILLDDIAQKALDLESQKRRARQPMSDEVMHRIQGLYEASARESLRECCIVRFFCATRDMWQQNCIRWGYGPRFHFDVRL